MKRFLCILLIALLALSCCAALAEEKPDWVRDDPSTLGDTLVLYSTYDDPQQKLVEGLWYKYYPDCKIEWVSDSVGKLIARARGEVSNPYADCIWGGLFETDGTMYQDVLQPYTPCNADQMISTDPFGYYTFFDVQYICLVVNKDLEAELGLEIKSYEDLLNPALKGKILLADPAATSSGYHQFFNMLAVMGDELGDDKAWEYIDKLIENTDGVITTSSSQVFKDVIAGEYVVGLSYENIVEMQIEKNGADNIRLVYPTEGNTGTASGAGMVKDCKHPEAAAAILDMAGSVEYQMIRLEDSCSRGTNGNIVYDAFPSDDELGAVKVDYEELGKQKEALLEKWQEHWDELA